MSTLKITWSILQIFSCELHRRTCPSIGDGKSGAMHGVWGYIVWLQYEVWGYTMGYGAIWCMGYGAIVGLQAVGLQPHLILRCSIEFQFFTIEMCFCW